MKNLWIIINFLLLFSACADDAYQEGSTGKDSEMLVTLDLKVPGIQTTRLTESQEEAITEVDLLAFDASGNYLYYKQGAKKGSYYEVTLKKSTEQQTFVVLANLRSQLGAEPTVGTAKADILKTIVFASTKTYTTLPMWGETKATISGAGTLTVKMLRAVARVDVKTNSGVNKSDFELTEVVVYNSLSQGRAVPDVGNMGTNSDGNPVATTPTLVTSASKNSKLTYTTTTNLFEREIYLSEYINKGVTDNSDRLCLVVGGKYKGGNATYYRIDFFGKETDKDSGKETQVLKDILRNYRYNVEITSVSGPGYKDPDDAFNSTPVNLDTEIIVWEDGDFESVSVDGVNYLGVTPSNLSFPVAESDLNIKLRTNLAWTATYYDANGVKIESGSWFTTTTSGNAGEEIILTVHTEQNGNDDTRTGYILFTAGRMNVRVNVSQLGTSSSTPDPIIGLTIDLYEWTSTSTSYPAVDEKSGYSEPYSPFTEFYEEPVYGFPSERKDDLHFNVGHPLTIKYRITIPSDIASWEIKATGDAEGKLTFTPSSGTGAGIVWVTANKGNVEWSDGGVEIWSTDGTKKTEIKAHQCGVISELKNSESTGQNGQKYYYGLMTLPNGKVWLDRNLGASSNGVFTNGAWGGLDDLNAKGVYFRNDNKNSCPAGFRIPYGGDTNTDEWGYVYMAARYIEDSNPIEIQDQNGILISYKNGWCLPLDSSNPNARNWIIPMSGSSPYSTSKAGVYWFAGDSTKAILEFVSTGSKGWYLYMDVIGYTVRCIRDK